MARDKINVLFLVPTLRRAGAETQAIALANGLDSAAFGKTVAIFSGQPEQADKLDSQSVTFAEVTRRRKWDFEVVRQVAELIDSYAIDLVHCTLQVSVLIGLLAARLSRRRPQVVAALHTTVNRSAKEEIYDRLLYRRVLRACDRIIYVCHRQRDYWEDRFPELRDKGVVVYNGVNVAAYRWQEFEQAGEALRNRLAIPREAPVIVCVAGFRPEKGHHHLVRAFRELPAEAHLVLAGYGPGREDIERLAINLGVLDRVHFMGEVGDVRPVLAASDLLVIASTAVETFSMALLEGMAMGLPAVVTDVGGLREAVVPGKTGSVVTVGSEEELARALAEAIADRDCLVAMGRAAQERVASWFSADQMITDTARTLEWVART